MVNKPKENREDSKKHPKRAKIGAILALTSALAGAAACDTQANEPKGPEPAPEAQKENPAKKQAEPNKVAESDFNKLSSFLEDEKHDPKLESERIGKYNEKLFDIGLFKSIKTEEGQLAFIEKLEYDPEFKSTLLGCAISDRVKKVIEDIDRAYLADLMANETVGVSIYYDNGYYHDLDQLELTAEINIYSPSPKAQKLKVKSYIEHSTHEDFKDLFKIGDKIKFVGPLDTIEPNDIINLTRFIGGSTGYLQLEAIKKCHGLMDARLLQFIDTEEGQLAFLKKARIQKNQLEFLLDNAVSDAVKKAILDHVSTKWES